MTEQMTDRNRWIALYVLCAGMLMIVLDVTVVNVALPSIQDDLGFSQSSLAWVVNAYLIAFGGLLLLAGRFGDILGRKSVFMAGLGVFTAGLAALCGVAQSQEVLVARPLRPGRRRRDDLRRDPRHDRHDVPRAAGAGEGDRRLRLRRLRRRLGRAARRRRADPVDQLALDLLRQHPDRDRHRRSSRMRLLERDEGIGFGDGADIPGAVLITSSLMLGVYTIVKPAAELRLGLGPGARARRRLARAAGRLRRARGDARATR